jgi:hypothetical protein
MQEETPPKFVIEIESIFKSIESEINILRQCEPSKKTDIRFKEIIVSAYVKAYDFVLYICRLNDLKDAFFQLPMLRGICEDLITITYLLNQNEGKRNFLVITKRFEELKKSTKAQSEFFNKYNSGQIVLPALYQDEIEPFLKVFRDAGHLLEESKLPNVFTMAKSVNLEDLYAFIYHATSKSVHFDIFTLFSMGWGTRDEENGIIHPNFSYKHDYKHYYTFALFYSSYLFLEQNKYFKEFLVLPQKIDELLLELENNYMEIDWPELITFDQMNLRKPFNLLKSVYRKIKDDDANI